MLVVSPPTGGVEVSVATRDSFRRTTTRRARGARDGEVDYIILRARKSVALASLKHFLAQQLPSSLAMGKRKKSSRKPATPAARRREPLGQSEPPLLYFLVLTSARADTTFTCLFCNHEKSVNVKIDKKEGIALLYCKVCGQRFQGRVNRASYTHLFRRRLTDLFT